MAGPLFTEDEIKVIRKRRFGWEGATFELLARVFNTTPQHIGVICRKAPAEQVAK